MKKFESHATWTKVPETVDYHDTKEAAEAVCKKLMNITNCPIRGKCTNAFINAITISSKSCVTCAYVKVITIKCNDCTKDLSNYKRTRK